MRRISILFLAIILVCAFCIGAAFVLPALQPKSSAPAHITPGNVGITAIQPLALIQPIEMQFALNEIKRYQPDPAMNRMNETIHYIGAKNLNDAGAATSWIFGVRNNNVTTIYIYDRNGVAIIPWDAGLPLQDIDFSTVLTPGELITSDRLQIPSINSSLVQTGVVLELMDGNYIITRPQGSSPQILTFNATTGALVSVYD
ncbi:MAG: hypothetical protein WC391_03985 [Methanoregula sp.]|jgi:hypothetical protein